MQSKADLIASLRASLNQSTNGETADPPVKTPVAPKSLPTTKTPVIPQTNGDGLVAENPFAKLKKAAAVAVVEEDEPETEAETTETADAETTPVEELLDRVESLIDFVVENNEALRSWINNCR